MINAKLRDKLIKTYQNMDTNIYEDDSKWSVEELAGYFLYNCSDYELKHIEFKNVKNECSARQEAWKLIKRVIYPFTYALR